MSAAPASKPDDAPAGESADAEGWALLEGLRRRLDDQAAQGRKTQAQVGQLAESIAALVAQQRRRSLWINVNSFVAYVVFTVLCGAGCYLLYRSRAHELSEARDRAVSERDAAVRHADEATVRAVAREAADTKAWEVYQLLEAGKRGEAVAKLDALRDQPLSRTERAVLAARVHDTQVMEVDAALKAAVAAFKAGRPGDVIKPLEAALTGEPSGARAATIHYYLGVAYARTDLQSAATHLQAAIAGDVDQDDARFQLASVLDRSGAFAAARGEYDRFATAHPQSPFAVFAMRRSATLARMPAVAPGGRAVAAPAIAPGPGAAPAPGTPGAIPPPAVGGPAASAPGAPGAIQPAAAMPAAPASGATRSSPGAAAPATGGTGSSAGTLPAPGASAAKPPGSGSPPGAAAPRGAATFAGAPTAGPPPATGAPRAAAPLAGASTTGTSPATGAPRAAAPFTGAPTAGTPPAIGAPRAAAPRAAWPRPAPRPAVPAGGEPPSKPAGDPAEPAPSGNP